MMRDVEPPTPPPTTWRPGRKVTAGSLAATLWLVVVLALAEAGVDLSDALIVAVGGLIQSAASYWTKEGL